MIKRQEKETLHLDREAMHEMICDLRDIFGGEGKDDWGLADQVNTTMEPSDRQGCTRDQHFAERLTLLCRQVMQLDSEFHDEFDCP